MTYEELAFQLAEINKKMMKISEYIRLADASRGEGLVLGYLAHHGNEATPVQLSEVLEVSTARIAALLNKMEQKQLVERQKHPENNRNIVVKLLPAGRELHELQERKFLETATGFFERLGEEKAALFVELQGEMVRYMMEKSAETAAETASEAVTDREVAHE